jgi:hypothetical protein
MPPVMFTIVGNPADMTISQCTFCALRSPDATNCRAFPEGIPVEIITNEHDHTVKFPGDNGILYKPVELAYRKKVPA